jgi:hypothetical protein
MKEIKRKVTVNPLEATIQFENLIQGGHFVDVKPGIAVYVDGMPIRLPILSNMKSRFSAAVNLEARLIVMQNGTTLNNGDIDSTIGRFKSSMMIVVPHSDAISTDKHAECACYIVDESKPWSFSALEDEDATYIFKVLSKKTSYEKVIETYDGWGLFDEVTEEANTEVEQTTTE